MNVPAKSKDVTNVLTSSSITISSGSGVNGLEAFNFPSTISSHNDFACCSNIEANAAASLSDDSGIPLTTNSSISSGDSYRLGMCKLGVEMAESDGEVSQFDSLENCSEGGMSAENFNTLKKGPLAPIDPPPEFQDSPQTTLSRGCIIVGSNISAKNSSMVNLRRWTSSQSSFEHLKENSKCTEHQNIHPVLMNNAIDRERIIDCHDTSAPNGVFCDGSLCYNDDSRTLKESYTINKHLYSSDSVLNNHTDNIYDEPNNIISNSLGNSFDMIDSDSSSPLPPPPPPPVASIKLNKTLCPYYQDHNRYFRAIPSEQDTNITSTTSQKLMCSRLSDIHDYDLYYAKRNHTYQHDSLQRKILYSPLNPSHYNYTGVGIYGNRPNSRNSLNSRLSSSHNSLTVSSTNKPDDSIFICQAMSHDALITREISDFYNVPVDSDIYAFPVDMIESEKENKATKKNVKSRFESMEEMHHGSSIFGRAQNHKFSRIRNHRPKRKKRLENASCEMDIDNNTELYCLSKESKSNCGAFVSPHDAMNSVSVAEIRLSNNVEMVHEPLHMSLDEVKQIYNTLYSSGSKFNTSVMQYKPDSALDVEHNSKPNIVQLSNETIWSATSTRMRNEADGFGLSSISSTMSVATKKTNSFNLKTITISDTVYNNINNNNDFKGIQNQKSCIGNQIPLVMSAMKKMQNHHQQHSQQIISSDMQAVTINSKSAEVTTNNNNNNSNNFNNNSHSNHKQTFQPEKKSQFTLNLKQKFCSIFRFRKTSNRRNYHRKNSPNPEENIADNDTKPLSTLQAQQAEDKRKKFQSRALPPLPKKNNTVDCDDGVIKSIENRSSGLKSFRFTSSIEKVKDYGWYWGPLSSEAAEKVLSNEPDGSFIVRDSSDDHYIFSLSFKLNNCVRHVRIEQDQGTFSFGSYAKFKSQTITEFIEKAVEHSRSGRYLFFLHRRPEHGPMRVQLTNPVSRFKHVQSLQHMCRFVILKAVIRKDLIQTLPLPRRLLDYLNYKHFYSEQIESDSSHSQVKDRFRF